MYLHKDFERCEEYLLGATTRPFLRTCFNIDSVVLVATTRFQVATGVPRTAEPRNGEGPLWLLAGRNSSAERACLVRTRALQAPKLPKLLGSSLVDLSCSSLFMCMYMCIYIYVCIYAYIHFVPHAYWCICN